MSDSDRVRTSQAQPGRDVAAPLPWPVFVITVVSSLASVAVALGAGGLRGIFLAVLASGLGGAATMILSKRTGDTRHARIRREENQLDEVRKTWGAAVVELEKTRHQIEVATNAYRGGVDPLTEIAELRAGPLHDLLEAARTVDSPVVSRIAVDEAELVGTGGEAIPGSWPVSPAPAPAPPPAPAQDSLDPRVRAEVLRALDEMVVGLEELIRGIQGAAAGASPAAAPGQPSRTPAQLVDAVVETAADGVEDLAAGLMRANEVASVAERVTNRATLLALNAALEATRSGGEAFGAIAEETRKLAEFAREATDTISRLADEIELKVGETITAIHATSEDAKTALGTMSPASPMVPAEMGAVRELAEDLLGLAKDIRAELASTSYHPEPTPTPAQEPPAAPSEPMLEVRPSIEVGADLLPEAAEGEQEEPEATAGDAPEAMPADHLLILDRLNPPQERRA